MRQNFMTKSVRIFITKCGSFITKCNFRFFPLTQLSISMYTFGFSHSKTNCIRNLKPCTKNEFFTMETLHNTKKINKLSFQTNLDLLAIGKVKYRSNHLYLKIVLILSGHINLNL